MPSNEWRKVSKRWGHPLHWLCSYPGAFPPRLPHYFIYKYTHPGDTVFDPFAGRGSAPLQACVEGRLGIAADAGSLAALLCRAALDPPDPADLQRRLDHLSNDMFFCSTDHEAPLLRLLFHPQTLSQLVFLKRQLDPADRTDRFLLAMLAGLVQGSGRRSRAGSEAPRRGSAAACLSLPLATRPDTNPRGLEEEIQKRQLQPPGLDVFVCLRTRADWLLRLGPPLQAGRAWLSRFQDLAQLPEPALRKRRVRLILSAPPTPGARRIGPANWLRLWLLNELPREHDAALDRPRNHEESIQYLAGCCPTLLRVLAPGGVCALALADTRRPDGSTANTALALWNELRRRRSRFRLEAIIDDPGPRPPIQRILVLYKDSIEERPGPVPW